MSFGNPRQPSAFSAGVMADANLQQQLTLYQPVATIRDMKQVFFYASINSGICWVHPLRFLKPRVGAVQWNWGNVNANPSTNPAPPDPNDVGVEPQFIANPWYLPMGTERTLDISNIVNDLLDIRVPKDKYVVEINLVECNIESDPTNWVCIPDFVFVNDGGQLKTTPTFVRRPVLSTVNLVGNFPGTQTLANVPQQATKVSTPQTLFVRIKELCNGEPYNWTVTTTGQYTLDKSHQLLIRHGDVNYSNLTLEFGHLVWNGLDTQQNTLQLSLPPEIAASTGAKGPWVSAPPPNPGPELGNNSRSDTYKYIDYNSEVFNAIGTGPVAVGNPFAATAPNVPASLDDYYISEYKTGYYDGVTSTQGSLDRTNLIQPASRPPFIFSPLNVNGGISVPKNSVSAGVPANDLFLLAQGVPLKSNQQAKTISFRFMVRIIHTF